MTCRAFISAALMTSGVLLIGSPKAVVAPPARLVATTLPCGVQFEHDCPPEYFHCFILPTGSCVPDPLEWTGVRPCRYDRAAKYSGDCQNESCPYDAPVALTPNDCEATENLYRRVLGIADP